MICRAMPYNPLLPNIKYLWKRLQCLCITNICGEMEAGHKYLTAATSHSVWHYKAAHDCLFGNAFRIKLINNGRSSLNTMSISTDVSSLPWSIYLPIDTETDWRANILSVRHVVNTELHWNASKSKPSFVLGVHTQLISHFSVPWNRGTLSEQRLNEAKICGSALIETDTVW